MMPPEQEPLPSSNRWQFGRMGLVGSICDAPLPARGTGGALARVIDRYRTLMAPFVRGCTGLCFALIVFALASSLPPEAGLLLGSSWCLWAGSYCLVNYWRCRETHCMVTGPGWLAVGLVGVISAASGMWFSRNAVLDAAVLVVLLGYGLEWVWAAATHRHSFG